MVLFFNLTFLKLLTLKYNDMCENKKIVQANHEFLNMSRVLLKEEQPECPVFGIQNLIKLQSFDKEIQALGDSTKAVDLMQLASQIP